MFFPNQHEFRLIPRVQTYYRKACGHLPAYVPREYDFLKRLFDPFQRRKNKQHITRSKTLTTDEGLDVGDAGRFRRGPTERFTLNYARELMSGKQGLPSSHDERFDRSDGLGNGDAKKEETPEPHMVRVKPPSSSMIVSHMDNPDSRKLMDIMHRDWNDLQSMIGTLPDPKSLRVQMDLCRYE